MKHFLLLFSLLLAGRALHAQTESPLYEGAIPGNLPGKNEETRATTGGILRIAKVSEPTLTVYKPSRSKANGAAVIICPGGGYSILAAGHEGADVAKAFNAIGVTAFVLKYRIPDATKQETPSIAPLQDAQQAIRIVRKNFQKWNIDPQRVGILGFSAGGHLAATAGTHFDSTFISNPENISLRPDYMMLIYPVISFTRNAHQGSAQNLLGKNAGAASLSYFSNDEQVTAATPPTFLVHATDDDGVNPENSIMFYEAARAHKVPAELHLYQQGGHGFGLQIKGREERWFERCASWMKSNGWLSPPVIRQHLYVKGRLLYTPGGEKIVLRGVNKMNVWSDKTGEKSFPEIAKTGANTVRIVWTSAGGGGPQLDTLIGAAVKNKLIPIIELHDATGDWNKLQACADYWVRKDVLTVIKKYQRYLLLNIANEAGDQHVTQEQFNTRYAAVIKQLRKAAIDVPLVIDAAGWGRNENLLLNGAEALLQADPDKNLIFSWHIWDSGITTGRISSTIDKSIQKNFMLLIGEFAPMEVKCMCCIPYHFIMEYCQQKGIGWLAWSWGPGNGDCPAMDMTKTDAFDSLYGWGKEVAETHPFSIKNTSMRVLSLFK